MVNEGQKAKLCVSVIKVLIEESENIFRNRLSLTPPRQLVHQRNLSLTPPRQLVHQRNFVK